MCFHRLVIVAFAIVSLLGARPNDVAATPLGTSARPTISVHARTRSAVAAAYAIRDVGMPPVTTYPSSSPIGFNNSGQIFGVALRAAKSDRLSYRYDTDCLVWTGTRFIDLEASLTVQQCVPSAINGADAESGTYGVVGSFTDYRHVLNSSDDAFFASVTASGASTVAPYYDHSPAELYGINAAGTAVGYSYNTVNNYAIFVTAPGRQLTFLQSSCGTTSTGCLATVEGLKPQTNGEPLRSCAFGGCTINASGTVLGVDGATSAYALFPLGASSPRDVPLYVQKGDFGFVVALNDANQIVYFSIGTPSATYLFNANSGTTTTVPPVAGTSCAHYYPISLNNLGKILGFSSFCKQKPFYYTWDPVNGTQELDLQIPASAYAIRPLGINDNGQILVSLGTSAGATHWGTLDPIAASVKHHAQSKESYLAR